ncbi:MAG: chromate efflux transporter [Terriglobia bacterium]
MADDHMKAPAMVAEGKYRDESADHVSRWSLFLVFLRLGLTAFGGPAMVAYIRDLAVGKKHWLSPESFADGTAMCQSIPGATAMQAAAYVGLRTRGITGALAAFVGFGLPAFVLMVALSSVYNVSRNLHPVAAGFRGLQVIVVALVANAVVAFGRSSIKNWRDLVLACGAATFLMLRGSPILAIVGSAAVSAVLYVGASLPVRPVHHVGESGGRRIVRWVLLAVLAGGTALAVLFVANRQLFNLALVMLKVDLSAFGGGFASVPVMLHQVVEIRKWIDSETFMDGIALGQVTPGPIVITATFVGYQIAGWLGAVVGTVAVFSPSFLMVLITVPYFDRLQRSVVFRRALRGILASFVGLLLAVTAHFAIAASWTTRSVLLALAAFVALRFKIDVLWVVLAGAAVAIFFL